MDAQHVCTMLAILNFNYLSKCAKLKKDRDKYKWGHGRINMTEQNKQTQIRQQLWICWCRVCISEGPRQYIVYGFVFLKRETNKEIYNR